jgi:hypothetical protein
MTWRELNRIASEIFSRRMLHDDKIAASIFCATFCLRGSPPCEDLRAEQVRSRVRLWRSTRSATAPYSPTASLPSISSLDSGGVPARLVTNSARYFISMRRFSNKSPRL